MLGSCELIELSGDDAVLRPVDISDAMIRMRSADIEALLTRACGRRLRVRIAEPVASKGVTDRGPTLANPKRDAPSPESGTAPPASDPSKNELVRLAMQLFDASIADIRPKPPRQQD